MPTLSSLMKASEDAADSMMTELESVSARIAKEEAKAVSFAQIMASIKAKAEGARKVQAVIQQQALQLSDLVGGTQQ